ncbi:hypothetical protein MMC28_003748 [Mycoblastus sanguinarius]|nr:hypothetical protein [Mycoblastus sanguinarius]
MPLHARLSLCIRAHLSLTLISWLITPPLTASLALSILPNPSTLTLPSSIPVLTITTNNNNNTNLTSVKSPAVSNTATLSITLNGLSNNWPQTPFQLQIPDLIPRSDITFLWLGRTGQATETTSLNAAIDEQISNFHAQTGLPARFNIQNADVSVMMRLATPSLGGSWMSMGEALGSLGVLKEAVRVWGARECTFMVLSGQEAKGTVWVRFLDGEG